MLDNLNMSDAVTLGNGALILIASILTMISSGFIWLLVLIGAGIMQSAFTGFCPMTMLYQKLNLFTDK
ncbi:YgaP family membrane protein [Leucothrix arctica]|uniref:DUF2892 domain-containing protein n=1 Tax=Leucothrix arctica TaxID=1481894 RepID=A0A317CMS0_9GAMM|nr:DUF2892 domain-containing protein [Leucothrix arctica]PWQ98753.1 DUF2892 domain-containing protein [Leucothrix arctica]